MKLFSSFNKALLILLWTNGLVLMAGAMLGPIYAIFVERVGGDLMDASIAGGIFAFVAGITTLLSGKYSDHMKQSELAVSLGYVIMGIGFLLYLWVESTLFLFVVQGIIGLGEAIYSPAFDATYSRHLTVSRSGMQWGAWESINYFTTAAGAIIGGIIATAFGFQALFVAMAALCFGSAFYIYHLKRNVL